MTKSGGALVSSAVSGNEVASFKTKLALEHGGGGRMLFPRSQEAVQLLHHSAHREATLPNEELRQQSGSATAVENGGDNPNGCTKSTKHSPTQGLRGSVEAKTVCRL